MPKIIELDETESTNLYIRKNLEAFNSFDVVTAKRQTNGRGRLGRVWESPPESLFMSMLIKDITVDIACRLPIICAAAALKAIYNVYGFLPDLGIKWPNDLVLSSNKICGILCESVSLGDNFNVICGIGVNIGGDKAYFKKINLEHADSLQSLTGKIIPPSALCREIASQIQNLYACNFTEIVNFYKNYCITLNKTVIIEKDGKSITAFAVDIDDKGNLICDNNGIFVVNAGEVSVRGLYGYC